MNNMRLIVSTLGTSILTNEADQELGSKLNQYANEKHDDLEQDFIDQVNDLTAAIKQELPDLADDDIKKKSAELNGLLSFYEEHVFSQQDFHLLIATDTFLGGKTYDLIDHYLRETKGLNVIGFGQNIRGLNTKSRKDFENGIKELLKDLDPTINDYRSNQFEVVFNLTGGFKGSQGLLSTVGSLKADRIVYLFETGSLIEIPKLPITIDAPSIEENADTLLQLADGDAIFSNGHLGTVPSLFLDTDNGENAISIWGKLIWDERKQTILNERLITLPFITYSNKFKHDFDRGIRDRMRLQETLAKVSVKLQEHNGDSSALRGGGLNYENYQNIRDDEGRSVGHFRISGETRVSCIVKDGILELRRFGPHDDVNNNPL